MDAALSDIVGYIDARLNGIERSPQSWGSPESIEFQTLLLLELRTFVLRRSSYTRNPREAREAYAAFMGREFKDQPPMFMCDLLPSLGREAEFMELIGKLRRFVVDRLGPENPADSSDLLIGMEFKHSVQPTFASVCGYYDRFRGALQRTALKTTRAREVRGEIEHLTNFPVPGVRTTHTSTGTIKVVVPLAHRNERQLVLGEFAESASKHVSETLRKILMLIQWAEGRQPVSRVARMFPVASTRRTLTLCALDMLPANDVEDSVASISLGGDWVRGKRRPELFGSCASRLRGIIDVEEEFTPTTVTGRVRALDRDQRWFKIKPDQKERITCWADMDPSLLDQASDANAENSIVTVTGKLYRFRAQQGRYLVVDRGGLKVYPVAATAAE